MDTKTPTAPYERVSADEYRQIPAPPASDQAGVTVLVIPDDPRRPITEQRLPVDNGGDCYDAVRAVIGGPVQHVPVLDGVDFLCDEESLFRTDIERNGRATRLAGIMKRRYADGTYPGKTPADPAAAQLDADAWARRASFPGTVVVIGERAGNWVSLPETALVFAEAVHGPHKRA